MVKYQAIIKTKKGSKVQAKFPTKTQAQNYIRAIKKELGGTGKVKRVSK